MQHIQRIVAAIIKMMSIMTGPATIPANVDMLLFVSVKVSTLLGVVEGAESESSAAGVVMPGEGRGIAALLLSGSAGEGGECTV